MFAFLLELSLKKFFSPEVTYYNLYLYDYYDMIFISDHTKDTAPVSHQLTEVKLLQALAVLWWGTTWEGRVSDKLLFFS